MNLKNLPTLLTVNVRIFVSTECYHISKIVFYLKPDLCLPVYISVNKIKFREFVNHIRRNRTF